MARSGAAVYAHLQVASSFSLQYGTATPLALANYAAGIGHDIVGLTDRDGVYGAVRWVQACQRVGISPVLGVDLAIESINIAAETKNVVPPHMVVAGWMNGAHGWSSLRVVLAGGPHFVD